MKVWSMWRLLRKLGSYRRGSGQRSRRFIVWMSRVLFCERPGMRLEGNRFHSRSDLGDGASCLPGGRTSHRQTGIHLR